MIANRISPAAKNPPEVRMSLMLMATVKFGKGASASASLTSLSRSCRALCDGAVLVGEGRGGEGEE